MPRTRAGNERRPRSCGVTHRFLGISPQTSVIYQPVRAISAAVQLIRLLCLIKSVSVRSRTSWPNRETGFNRCRFQYSLVSTAQ
jgi:hypothetical protein